MKRETRTNILLCIISSICAIIFLEVVLQILKKNPEKITVIKNTIQEELFPYRFIPNSSFTEENPEFSMTVKINSLGLRDKEYDDKDFNDCFRIIGTGDSFTFGVGVKMEEGYLAIAEKILNENSFNTKIIKAGMPGFNPVSELNFIKHYVQPKIDFQFNMIIIGFLPNDIDEMISDDFIYYGSKSQERLNSHNFTSFKGLIRSSLIYQSFKQLKIFRVVRGKLPFHYGRKMNDEEKQDVLKIVAKTEAFSHSIPVIFVLIPQMDNILYKAYPDMFDVIKEVSTEKNIFFVDTFDELVKYDPYKIYYKKDQHLTRLGQEIVGKVLAEQIINMRL